MTVYRVDAERKEGSDDWVTGSREIYHQTFKDACELDWAAHTKTVYPTSRIVMYEATFPYYPSGTREGVALWFITFFYEEKE